MGVNLPIGVQTKTPEKQCCDVAIQCCLLDAPPLVGSVVPECDMQAVSEDDSDQVLEANSDSSASVQQESEDLER